jgi:hypothetical protein
MHQKYESVLLKSTSADNHTQTFDQTLPDTDHGRFHTSSGQSGFEVLTQSTVSIRNLILSEQEYALFVGILDEHQINCQNNYKV